MYKHPLANLFDNHSKKEREEKIKHACVKLVDAIDEGEGEYIAKRIAYLLFLSNQFIWKYNWQYHIYRFTHDLETKYLYRRVKDEQN